MISVGGQVLEPKRHLCSLYYFATMRPGHFSGTMRASLDSSGAKCVLK